MKTHIVKPALLGLISTALLLCGGCVSRVSKATYPEAWSAPKQVSAAQCPALAGRYGNAGESAPGTKAFFCGSHSQLRGTWCGQTALSQNIGDRHSGDWVELRQPDDDTLLIVSSDPTVAVQELHQKSGDFSCSNGVLERHLRVGSFSNGDNSTKSNPALGAVNTVMGAAMAVTYASGGVRTLNRRFSKAADGSLVMSVSQTEGGMLLLIPYHEQEQTYVRWTPATTTSAEAATSPALTEAAAPATDLPADHVGLFEAMNGKMWSKVKVTNLDGAPVNTQARYPGTSIAMEPGTHWIQVGAATTHVMPLRDLDTKYAFVMETVAGHRYRMADRPSTCLAPGNIDAAIASSSIYHARVAVIDEAPGAQPRTVELDALCSSAHTYDCAAGADAGDGLQCVIPAGWKHGYYGKDSGPVPAQ